MFFYIGGVNLEQYTLQFCSYHVSETGEFFIMGVNHIYTSIIAHFLQI